VNIADTADYLGVSSKAVYFICQATQEDMVRTIAYDEKRLIISVQNRGGSITSKEYMWDNLEELGACGEKMAEVYEIMLGKYERAGCVTDEMNYAQIHSNSDFMAVLHDNIAFKENEIFGDKELPVFYTSISKESYPQCDVDAVLSNKPAMRFKARWEGLIEEKQGTILLMISLISSHFKNFL